MIGNRGERGPTGDHGQEGATGNTGERGPTGDTGERGQRGPAYTSWLTRHVVAAYLILLTGVVLGFVFTYTRFELATSRINQNAVVQCERGNGRTEQLRNLLLRARAASATAPSVTPEQRETAAKFYSESLDALPLVSCPDAKPLPLPPLPPIPTTPGG